MTKKFVAGLLTFLIFLPAFLTFYQQRQKYFKPTDLETAQYLYPRSQYVLRGDEAAWIPDETLFTYAGWNYVSGGNPILVNPENPPLGKYLIGASLLLTKNANVFNLLFGLLSLVSLWLLSGIFLNNYVWSSLPVILFAWGKLYREQLTYVPLFETFALTFLIFVIYFFIRGYTQSRYFLASSIALGFLWGTRPWMATAPLIVSFLIYLLFVNRKLKKFFEWGTSLALSILVLILVYIKLILIGWSIYQVLSVQKWILWYHQSRLINIGSVWPFLFLNRWHIWWSDVESVPVEQWSVLWPIFTSLSLVFSLMIFLKILGIKKRRFIKLDVNNDICVLCLWIVFYLSFLSVGNVNARYVFYLIPFVYIVAVKFLYILLNNTKNARLKSVIS